MWRLRRMPESQGSGRMTTIKEIRHVLIMNLVAGPPSRYQELWQIMKKLLDNLITEINFLVETTQAETDKILETINEDQQCPDSQAQAIIRSSYYNNGYIHALQQILGKTVSQKERSNKK